MTSVFEPLSALEPKLLIDYLGREGKSPEIVRWKYFDSNFNRGRVRGYALMQDGQIGGFIGLIPFQVIVGGRTIEAAWTCDWSVQDLRGGNGSGVLLIRHAHKSYEYLVQLGGNEATHYIISRLAAKTAEDAALMFYLPLRLGAVLRMVARRQSMLRVDAFDAVNRIPLRLPGLMASQNSVVSETGVSDVLCSILRESPPGEDCPSYDLEYLRWQIGTCPTLASETYTLAGTSDTRAAALIWREKSSPEFWRITLWSCPGAEKEGNALLSAVIRNIYDQQGFMISILVSRKDTELISLLRRNHFLCASRRRPLYVLTGKKSSEPIPELSRLSFLDTDLAHRF
jgi:hypothetical protein